MFVQGFSVTDPRADDALLPIFRAYGMGLDPRVGAVILLALWTRLECIARWKWRWDDDADQLWMTILEVFVRAIRRLDVDRRRSRLAQKISNDVVHDLYLQCERNWKRTEMEIETAPDWLEGIWEARVPDLDEAIDLRVAHERAVKRLREHLRTGRLTEADFRIVGTTLYGQPLAEFARAEGLDYALVRKRRWRLERALGLFEDATD